MSFFENTRKPVGLGGKIMVAMMNVGHSAMAAWGLRFLQPAPDAMVLDCGCGGGANIKTLLKLCPKGKVQGIDYSAVSVEKARKVNAGAIAAGQCTVQQASVAELPFEAEQFDVVTAFETVYFWPELAQNFREVYRVLKPGGIFFICNEANGETTKDDRWTQIINGMTIYTDTALKEYLEQVNRIWQTQKDAIEETKKAYQMGDDWANSDRSGYTNIAGSITDLLVKVNTVAAGGLLSPEGLVYLDSAKKVDPDLDYRLLNGQSENCFYPRSIVGISAKASEKEAAEKFVKFLFEEESQRASNDEGLAVNSKVYEDMAYWKMGKSSGDTIGSIGTSYDTGDGNIKQFVMDEIIPEDEAIQNIMDLGKTLTVPAKSNQMCSNGIR